MNRDFGSIFSSLLPGTTAKLEPVEGTSVLDGLEVKVSLSPHRIRQMAKSMTQWSCNGFDCLQVAFGNVWKETLTELSGGQRSLLALSLILALLLFKPAPMYILDEVGEGVKEDRMGSQGGSGGHDDETDDICGVGVGH